MASRNGLLLSLNGGRSGLEEISFDVCHLQVKLNIIVTHWVGHWAREEDGFQERVTALTQSLNFIIVSGSVELPHIRPWDSRQNRTVYRYSHLHNYMIPRWTYMLSLVPCSCYRRHQIP